MCPIGPNSLPLMTSVKGNLLEVNSVWTTTGHTGCWKMKGGKSDNLGREGWRGRFSNFES